MSEATSSGDIKYVDGEPISDKSVTYVEAVGKYDEGPPAPLDVVFFGHAAVFNLERNHPCFLKWLGMLQKSANDKTTIVFTATVWGGMRIQSVEPGDNIVGVVEEIFHGMQPNSTGFAIPGYADIFLIPNDHPRFLDWLVLLHDSKNGHVKIGFAYDASHRRVTSLRLAED